MSGLHGLGRAVAREQDALLDQPRDRARLVAHLQRAGRPARRGSGVRRRVGLAAAAVLLVGGASLLALPAAAPERRVLTARVGEEPARAGAFLHSPAGESRSLEFSDGTRVAMAPSTRLRLLELSERGARVSLEAGEARVAVAPRPRARWSLSAGPFSVRVTGTRFGVRWDPERDRFEVNLVEGEVEVRGCVFERGYRLRAGQRLIASCGQRRFAVNDRDAPPPDWSEPARTPRTAAATPEPQAERVRPARQRAATREREASTGAALSEIRRLAARGQHERAYARAGQAGFESLCARAGAETLMLLADTARYAGAREREAFALRRLRRRFARTPLSARAAFALGRLAFDHHGAFDEAARWFGRYLRERPGGALSREARGRLLEAKLRAGDRAAAARLSADYLRRYPDGPHAALARQALQPTAR